MTVAELITALRALPPEAQDYTVVLNSGWECGQTDLQKVQVTHTDESRFSTPKVLCAELS